MSAPRVSAEFRESLLGFVVAWCQRAGRAQLRTSLVDREIFRTVIAGRRLLVSDDYDGANGDSDAAGVVHAQSSSCCTSPDCSSSTGNHLAAAQVRKDAHSKAAEQTTEISTQFIDREFLPIMTNQERGVQNLEFILQQMHTMLTDLTSGEANDIVANSRKNPLEVWRRLQKRYDPTAGGRKRNLLRTIVSPERCSLLELQAGMERWESAVSQYEEKSKNKMNDEIKLAGLEALVPKELEKHLILNSNRLRTVEGRRREVVTQVEKQFGFTNRDSKPSDTGLREHSGVGAVNKLSLVSRRKRVIRFACWMF